MPENIHRDRLRVVLVSTRNPLNIGAAARAMSNFGFLRLRVVNPYEAAYREAKSAMAAAPVLESAEEFSSLAEAVADCPLVVGTTSIGHRQLQHPVRRLEYGGRLIRGALETGNVALLFGSEKFGLSNEEMSHCHWLLRAPAREEHGSMNLGQAVAVCLYELIREGAAESVEPLKPKSVSAGDMERLTTVLFELLHQSGYINPRTTFTTEEKIRRMVRRMDLSAHDAEMWLGMLRQILWKLKAAPPGIAD